MSNLQAYAGRIHGMNDIAGRIQGMNDLVGCIQGMNDIASRIHGMNDIVGRKSWDAKILFEILCNKVLNIYFSF